ncbi:MAG TPA: helix-turn-helix transcriptional regulator [Bryobacteraceae bacterium]|jgi:transcriptional regulator with XRE-family HTH domain|nr:helix-turn-helix transcriptional regulator [Bryobacteraceae bacterium]
MDVSLVIKERLGALGFDQRDLAAAVQVTDSYISQLLTRKKAPPAPGRTDIYDRIGEFLKLPAGELSKLAEAQRQEELKKRVAAPPRPLFQEFRELVLRKCDPETQKEVRRIFEKEPFGELERLVTQKLLDVTQGVAKEELRSEEWLRLMAQLSGRSYEQMRVAMLDFLDTDVFNVSIENCVSFLDPMLDSWDIDLKSFGMEVALNPRWAPGSLKRFEFVEVESHLPFTLEPGFEQFLNDQVLSGDASEEEIEFLKTLSFKDRHPSAMYYYRELQSLRDPLHFPTTL